MHGLSPFVWAIARGQTHERYKAFTAFLERRGSIEYICRRIEALDGDYKPDSPYDYLDDLSTALIIQHAVGDRSTAWRWSEALARELYLRGKPYEFWTYDSDEHLFTGTNLETAVARDVDFFDTVSR